MEEKMPSAYLFMYKNRLFVKYLISGFFAAFVDLSSLYLLTEYVFSPRLYLVSVVFAFIFAFMASFSLQKFWTFKDNSTKQMGLQVFIYFLVAVANLALNLFVIFVLVEVFDLWYFFAQVVAGILLAGVSFVLYNRFVFKHSLVVKGSVLLACGIFPPDVGGPATHNLRFLKGLNDRGIKTGVVTYSDVKKSNINDSSYEVERVSRKYLFGIRHLIFFFRLLISSLKYEIIYAQDITATGVPATIVAFLFKKRFFLRIGGDILWERIAESGRTNLSVVNFYKENKHLKYYLYHIGQSVLMKAEKIIVPTDLLANIYENYYGIPENKIIVIPNPLQVVQKSENVVIEKNILFAGRFVKYKNLQRLIIAFANIYNEIKPAKLVLVGEGPEKRDLVRLTKKLNIKNQVLFKDKMNQNGLMKEIESSSLCIGPALTEFNPNFILECLSLEKPVLLTKENGLSIKLPPRFLLDPDDIKDMENRIIDLLSLGGRANQELLNSIKSSKVLSWDGIIDEHIKIFNQ